MNSPNKITLFLIALLGLLLMLPAIVPAQQFDLGPPFSKPAETEPLKEQVAPEKEIQSRIADIEERIKKFSETETEEVATGLAVTIDMLRERTETLQEILAYYTRQLNAIKKQAELLTEKELLEGQISTGEAFKLEEAPPYPFKIYEEQLKKLTDNERNKQTAEAAVKISRALLENARARLKEAGQQKRLIKEAAAPAEEGEKVLLYNWQLAEAEREEELSQAIVAFHEAFDRNTQLESELADLKLGRDQQIMDMIRPRLYFTRQDYEKEIAAIEAKRSDLQGQTRELLKKQGRNERLSIRAQKKIYGTGNEEAQARAKAEVQAWEQWRQTYYRRLEQSEGWVEVLNSLKELWGKRFRLFNDDADANTLNQWRKEALDTGERFQQIVTLEQNRQNSYHLQISKLDERIGQKELSEEIKIFLKEERNAVIELARGTFLYIGDLGNATEMFQNFLDEITFVQKHAPLSETLRSYLGLLVSLWHYEIYAVEESTITLGKMIIALTILILGVMLIRQLTKVLHRRMVSREKINESTASIIEKLLYYAGILTVLLSAMRIVNIPLTAFTFMGGAVAIGIGFGAQKLINNFISGFILMAEQPIKVGDLIQMGEEMGWVDEIGARCTRVRTFANINILVPNSHFLENNIINWTHTDNIVRGKVRVGVIYGSSLKEVKKKLLQAAEEHGEILNHPEPFVWFTDFGENALIFDLYFWISVSALTGHQRIESDLRFIIDGLFRAAKIVSAFPQRDIHLDASKPLKIELSRNEEADLTARPEKERQSQG